MVKKITGLKRGSWRVFVLDWNRMRGSPRVYLHFGRSNRSVFCFAEVSDGSHFDTFRYFKYRSLSPFHDRNLFSSIRRQSWV